LSDLFTGLKQKVSASDVSIVFPEGLDERVLGAVSRLAADNILKPIVVGNKDAVASKAAELNVKLDGVEVLDPQSYSEFDGSSIC